MRFNRFKEAIFILAGSSIIAFNFLFVGDIAPAVFPILNVIGALTAAVPPVLIFYDKYKKKREIEEQFIVFIRDLGDSINAGMTLPLALSHCSKSDYMALGPYVNDMAAQVDWGIPFNKALGTFSKKVGSVSVKRAVTTIVETYKAGGKISGTLEAINRSLVTIEKIRKERSSSVHTQVVTSYMIFFVFIFILVILQSFLIPALINRPFSGAALSVMDAPASLPSSKEYADLFSIFIVMQGFFAGLATGKMAEGSLASGLKHSIVLIVSGYLAFSMLAQFQFGF